MTTKNIRMIPLLLTLSTVLLPASAIASTPDGDAKSGTPFLYDFDETYPLPPSQQIRLNSKDAKVTVSGSDRNDVRVRAHYSITSSPKMLQNFVYRLNVARQGPELRIEEMRKTGSRRFVYDKQAQIIEIDVPRNANVRIEEEDGTCVVAGIAGAVDVRMDDGRVQATDCSGPITVAHDNGTVEHRNCTGAVRIQHR